MDRGRAWWGAPAFAGDSPSAAPAGGRVYPPASWPRKESLTYTKELITTMLLVLALPWLVIKLLTDPALLMSGLGRSAATPRTS